MEEKFDVIIVGAGLAGSAAALKLAQAGLEVVLIERGPYPGAKNLSGGVLYGPILHDLVPNYWEEAPIERYITNDRVVFMTEQASFNIDFKNQIFKEPPYNAISVLRGKFDRWLAEKAEEAGAMLVPGIKVDRVIVEDNRAVGIVAGDEEMRSDVVILADGANSFLAEQLGLRKPFNPAHMAVGVKELIGLPKETIEERFNLTGDEGVAYGLVGYATQGVAGGGFLYTNKESLSVGLVMHLDELLETGKKPAEMMEDFLANQLIAPLIRGGKMLEYGAHMVPEGGLAMTPQLVMDGLLVTGDAAGLSINNGFVVRGMDLALSTGMSAAEAVLSAKKDEDFSAASLGVYQKLVDESFVMKDMHTYAGAPSFMMTERLYAAYPEMLVSLMTQIYTHTGQPKNHLVPIAMKSLKKSGVSLFNLAGDGLKGVRSL
jgi:electron transfer flavoprotein-quinone oxidoreductase